MKSYFIGEINPPSQQKKEIKLAIKSRIHKKSGTFLWPEYDDEPTYCVLWNYDESSNTVQIELTNFEDSLEDYEIPRRERIAEVNEY